MQSVFTDRRAYVNALTYELETSTSASAKASKQKDIDAYKAEKATVEFPDGSKKQFTFPQLEETYNEIRDERTKLSLRTRRRAEAGDCGQSEDGRIHLRPHGRPDAGSRFDGLKKKTTDWDPAIVQINVADANIVDRCESCHMGIARAAEDHRSGDDVKGREEAGRIRARRLSAIPSRSC